MAGKYKLALNVDFDMFNWIDTESKRRGWKKTRLLRRILLVYRKAMERKIEREKAQ